ncbi:hypothetical protein CLOM_g5987 [Closterium sp. NIES-68]|nr:hypothetical protein CLOM_g5987 [Closterium sp. NIES-68]
MMMLQRHSRFSTRVVVVMAAVALFLAAVFVAPSQAGPLTTFIVGGSYFIPQPNPWNLQAYRYNPRRVLP